MSSVAVVGMTIVVAALAGALVVGCLVIMLRLIVERPDPREEGWAASLSIAGPLGGPFRMIEPDDRVQLRRRSRPGDKQADSPPRQL